MLFRLFNSAAQQTNSWLLYTQLAGGSKKYFTFSKNQLASSGGLTIIVDPFGTPYAYFCPVSNVTRFVDNVASNEVGGLVNKVSFDLFSFGSDSATYVSGSTWATDPARSVDDITNWK